MNAPKPDQARPDQARPDQQRDAAKYSDLVNALRRATKEIRKMEEAGILQIDHFLERILPLFTKALDAEMAFAAKQLPPQSDLYTALFENQRAMLEKELGDSVFPNNRTLAYPFAIMVAQPRADLVKQKLYLSKRNFGELVINGKPWVHSPFGDDPLILIPDLEPLRVTSAVIVRLNFVNDTYIVGICNKKKGAIEPFLAPDRDALDSIVNLIISGARLNEQHRREYRAIQRISETATEGNPAEVWRTIAQQITQITGVSYTSLVALDRSLGKLASVGIWDAVSGDRSAFPWTLPLDENSMNGYVALNGTPLYAPDVKKEEHFQLIAGYRGLGIHSAFCVPLKIGGETIGTIYLANKNINSISPENQEIVKRIAPHAAIALHNANLHNEAEIQKQIQQRVITIQQKIAQILTWQAQLEEIRENLSTYFDVNGFFLATHDPTSGQISFPEVYVRGQKVDAGQKTGAEIFAPRLLGERRGTVEWVIEHRTSLRVEDFSTSPYRHQIDEPFYRDVKSCLLTPLWRGDQIIGVLGLRSYDRTNAYDHSAQQLLESLSSHIVVVIENSRQYEQRLSEISAVSQFQRLISTLDVDPQRLDETTEPDLIVRRELESLYPHARAALQGIGIRTEDMLLVLYESVEKIIRFALVYEAGATFSEAVIHAQEYYYTRKLDDRKDLVNWIIANDHREVLLLNKSDYAQWNALHPEVHKLPTRAQSFLGTALIYRDKLIGVIVLRDLQSEGTFTTQHKGLLATIASQVAIVIGNAQLYEQSRKQQREVERATNIAVMGAWEAEIGHDLNAEIGDLRGQLFEILDGPHDLSEIVRTQLLTIDQAIGRLALSEFTVPTPEIGQKPDGYEYPIMDEVLDSEIRQLQQKWIEEGDDAQIEFTPNCAELRVAIDEWWIRKFLRHFVSNARKYSSPDRRLRMAIHSQSDDSYVKVCIRDNGKGIDPKIAALLFKQLVPVAAARPGISGGRGLALVGFVCERFRGTARLVQSDPQSGSEFEFTIPIANDY